MACVPVTDPHPETSVTLLFAGTISSSAQRMSQRYIEFTVVTVMHYSMTL